MYGIQSILENICVYIYKKVEKLLLDPLLESQKTYLCQQKYEF